MSVLILFFTIFSGVFHIECSKSYRFASIETCKADNDLVANISKCEADGIYLTIKLDLKQPFIKLLVSF